MENLFIIKWLCAFSPIAVVLVLMIGFKWGGGRAGAAGWFTALIVSIIFFGADATLLAYAQTKGILLAIYVLYIVWMALVLYNVVQETGAIETIGVGIKKLTDNRALQLLILGWVFSSFLQGVAGFGVPIAVVGPLLMGMGFSPIVSVAVPAIGHSWSVTYGDMASSFQALIAVTGMEGLSLAHWSSVFLGLTTYLCGLAVVFLFGGIGATRKSLPAIIIIGTVMAGTQYLLSVTGLWTLAGFVAGMAGILAGILVTRMPAYRHSGSDDSEAAKSGVPHGYRHRSFFLYLFNHHRYAFRVIRSLARLAQSSQAIPAISGNYHCLWMESCRRLRKKNKHIRPSRGTVELHCFYKLYLLCDQRLLPCGFCKTHLDQNIKKRRFHQHRHYLHGLLCDDYGPKRHDVFAGRRREQVTWPRLPAAFFCRRYPGRIYDRLQYQFQCDIRYVSKTNR